MNEAVTESERVGKDGPFVEMMEDLGWTPLHCMVEKENVTVIKELLRQGANVSAHDNFNRTPLSIAACKGNLEIVKLLLEEGANSNDGFPLHYACENGHAEIAQHLIKNGADVNLGRDDNYPLLIAAARGHLEATKVLIDNGADVHVVDENKETALHWACDNGSEDIISLLIDAGCDVNITDRYSMTPLSICLIRKENEPELVRLLLQKGASANVADDQGCTYLHSVENVESALELVKYGADINAQNVYKETPLYNLSFYGHFDCAKALLQNGADPNIVANGGWTPLHIAAAEDNLDFVEELIKWKADVNAASSRNIIPLHLAALNGHLQIVTKLLENGSLIDMPIIDLPDINYSVPHFVKRDSISDGFTPLAIAASNQHVEVCKLLVSHGADCGGISSLPLEIVELKSTKRMRDWPCNDILDLVRSNNLSEIKNVSDDDCLSATDLVGWSALHHSVAKNLYEMSWELINKGVSVNSLDKYRRTPLSVAAARNNVRMLRLLIDNGADVNLGLALHYAAEEESIDCILELIKHNCDIEIKNEHDSQSPVLVEAASNHKTNVVKFLLEHKANPNCTNKWGETPLHNACRFEDYQLVEILLAHGANVNAVDNFKDTPLMCASYYKNLDIIKSFLAKGADPNVQSESKWTVLHHVCSTNFDNAAIELIKAGVCVDACNSDGETALFLATESTTIIKALVKEKADVNHRALGGWTPLHAVVYDGDVNCVKELLLNNANVNAASAENVLPIYLASICGSSAIVKELLDNGSYIDSYIIPSGVIRDDSGNLSLQERYHIIVGNTPIIGAASKGHLEVVKLLLSYGASLNVTNSEGNNLLHEAVQNDHAPIVEYLTGLNVNLNVNNKDNKTPLDIANEKSNEAIIHLLENNG